MVKKSRCLIWTFAVAFVLGGCGEAPTGDVSGKVMFRGNPLTFGTIAFINQNGRTVSAAVREGTYHIAKAPVGLAKITVHVSPSPVPIVRPDQIKSMASSQPQKPSASIPQRYQDSNRSGLTYTVVAGQQTFDVTLLP